MVSLTHDRDEYIRHRYAKSSIHDTYVDIMSLVYRVITKGTPIYYNDTSVWYYTLLIIDSDTGNMYTFNLYTGEIGIGELRLKVNDMESISLNEDCKYGFAYFKDLLIAHQ